MPVEEMEIEGTWEEILRRSSELRGRRVRLKVLQAEPDVASEEQTQNALAWIRRWHETDLTEAEQRALDEFPAFRKEHPFRLRRLDLENWLTGRVIPA